MIVVDTNVIGYLFLSGEQSLLAEQTLQKDDQWAAPLLWRSEFANVLVFYLRKEIISLEQARRLMESALALLNGYEYEVAPQEVLGLAAESRCSAYDCEFVATALYLKVPLVTADRQVLKAFPRVAVPLRSFVKQGGKAG